MGASYSFLGQGMKFPPQVNMATGRFETSSGDQSVKESVYMILTTNRGERWLRPDFGSELSGYTFMDVNATTLNIMRMEISQNLQDQEPRIRNVSVSIDSTSREGCLIIDLGYEVIETNTRDNLVFPFYLNAAAEEEARNDEETETL